MEILSIRFGVRNKMGASGLAASVLEFWRSSLTAVSQSVEVGLWVRADIEISETR